MKKLRIKFLALLLITSVAFSSCKKEDHFSPSVNSNTGAESKAENRPIINQSDWKITLFQVNDRDETRQFIGYLFVFAEKGILKATAGRVTVNGTWSAGNKDNPKNFIIMFPSQPLSKLSNNQWIIINRNANELKLEHINRKGGHEYLIFQRVQIQTEINSID
ncbi:MAG: hypothetical protein H7141_09465 [Burkholderiales bacterium]|nr:hypothetical protein [Bacteroidia bacterium]